MRSRSFLLAFGFLLLLAVVLITTGEVLECVMMVNPYETWCD
jgi:hypothetical protein